MSTTEFVSRHLGPMNWDALVRAWIPEATNEDVAVILWELTCYPMGGVAEVEPQIARVAAHWPNLGPLQREIEAEIDVAMKNRVHRLKTVQPYFDEVASGRKTFEIRNDDRGFQVGHQLHLCEWGGEAFTGRELRARVTYLLGEFPGLLMPGTVVMSIALEGE